MVDEISYMYLLNVLISKLVLQFVVYVVGKHLSNFPEQNNYSNYYRQPSDQVMYFLLLNLYFIRDNVDLTALKLLSPKQLTYLFVV